jgi:hypothetical protein
MVLLCLARAVVQFPFLARGADGKVGVFGESDPGPPFFLTVVNFVVTVLGSSQPTVCGESKSGAWC